ncbi:MAG: CHC2 zinc finger domain-containing protein [Candidatus Taylorbacteria bacterium]|nr:CHC2 zinc finger domain-containing protein [Candidatus Taylorbacteria bacterium]
MRTNFYNSNLDALDFHEQIEAENTWKKSLRLTDKEIVEAFYDQELFYEKNIELEQDCVEIKKMIKDKLGYLKNNIKNKEEAEILRTFIISSSIRELIETENLIKYLKRLRIIKAGRVVINKNRVTRDDIDRAKQVPLDQIVSEFTKLRKCGRGFMGLCPFHQERTPSFHINPETNTYNCFGACQKHGDIINFVQEKYNLTFIPAVKQLLTY